MSKNNLKNLNYLNKKMNSYLYEYSNSLLNLNFNLLKKTIWYSNKYQITNKFKLKQCNSYYRFIYSKRPRKFKIFNFKPVHLNNSEVFFFKKLKFNV